MAQKPLDGNDAFFETRFFEFLIVVRKKQMTFLEFLDKINKIGIFRENFDFQNLTFFDLNLT